MRSWASPSIRLTSKSRPGTLPCVAAFAASSATIAAAASDGSLSYAKPHSSSWWSVSSRASLAPFRVALNCCVNVRTVTDKGSGARVCMAPTVAVASLGYQLTG
jgi:hypothetical protein